MMIGLDSDNHERKNMADNSEFLYHYTNIETLALILKNRTIRFNSLDKMDDRQEQQTADICNIGQFCYISSWTDEERESIPMWNMYASLTSGVRIKLRKNPFAQYENTAEELAQVAKMPVTDGANGKPLISIIPLVDMFEKGYYSPQALNKQLLFQVEYTDDTDKLYPSIYSEEGSHFHLAIGKMGKCKNLHWEFQKEWRYILQILPFNLNQSVDNIESDFLKVANRMKVGIEKPSFSFYDMYISDEAFKEMEITLSPCVSMGNRIIVQSLIEKYNLSAKIKDSDLIHLL